MTANNYALFKNHYITEFQRPLHSLEDALTWEEDPFFSHFHLLFVGRSNVGKSTFLNALFKDKMAKVSNTPGRTRAINLFKVSPKKINDPEVTLPPPFFLADLPGYGHAEVSKSMRKEWDVLMGHFFSNLPAQHLIFHLIDARHPNLELDTELLGFMAQYTRNICCLFTKMDKLKTQKERAALEKRKLELSRTYKLAKEMYFVSSEKKTNLAPVVQTIETAIKTAVV